MFLDFETENFNFALLKDEPINILSFDNDMCCLIQNEENCDCPNNFELNKTFFSKVTEKILMVLSAAKEKFHQFLTASCNQVNKDNLEHEAYSKNYNETTKFFEDRLNESFFRTPCCRYENNLISMNMLGSVKIGKSDGGLKEIVKVSSLVGVVINEGEIVKSVKPMYRIGMTHVGI